tara:strand:+ start:158 stop:340 length:183 start_codon:yes stop_codon:yes gene_type:complete
MPFGGPVYNKFLHQAIRFRRIKVSDKYFKPYAPAQTAIRKLDVIFVIGILPKNNFEKGTI